MAKSRNSEDEKLDDANIDRVIKMLEPEEGKPITKKLACELLNITYNTTRLAKLIEEYKEKVARTARMRAAKRGKPASVDERNDIITEYMKGAAVSVIADSIYRSPSFVNNVLTEYSVPRRATSYNYFKPELIPEGAARDRFPIGEKVYAARYDSLAVIEAEQLHKSGQYVYRVWLLSDKWQQYAYQEACELASLQHLRELGIKI